jgi:hypothetical protein
VVDPALHPENPRPDELNLLHVAFASILGIVVALGIVTFIGPHGQPAGNRASVPAPAAAQAQASQPAPVSPTAPAVSTPAATDATSQKATIAVAAPPATAAPKAASQPITAAKPAVKAVAVNASLVSKPLHINSLATHSVASIPHKPAGRAIRPGTVLTLVNYTKPAPQPVQEAAIQPETQFRFHVEGFDQIVSIDGAGKQMETRNGEVFFLTGALSGEYADGELDQPISVHYSCDQDSNCMVAVAHSGVFKATMRNRHSLIAESEMPISPVAPMGQVEMSH